MQVGSYWVAEDTDDEWTVFDGEMRPLSSFDTEEEAQLDATRRAIDEAACEMATAADDCDDLVTLQRVLSVLSRATSKVESLA